MKFAEDYLLKAKQKKKKVESERHVGVLTCPDKETGSVEELHKSRSRHLPQRLRRSFITANLFISTRFTAA